ncbi:YchJ family protein [Solimonas soli]|uniref:YchJ family protein n=1 Tax=Solimonas soli TaxID=413479 RepID=UPI00048485B8|nr:YchJ family metal-binding protein [Solimonas soli]
MVKAGAPADATCACGSARAYAQCCGALHAGAAAADAEALMRSRYSAYARGLEPYLLDTWDAATRPARVAFDPATRWLGLKVLRHVANGDAAVVEFVAKFKIGGGSAQGLHERSRFRREAGRWFYVDGEFPD